MTIDEIQDEVIEEFEMFDEWMDKYEHLIELGKELPLIAPENKVDENLIKGCQSRVWLHAALDNGHVQFTAESDAIITKGIISLMVRVLGGHAPNSITSTELYFVEKIGLHEHLSQTRSNGIMP